MFNVIKSIPYDLHYKLVLETVDQKPDIKTVLWFSSSEEYGLIPHIADESRVKRARSGVAGEKFRKTQNELFRKYFGLTDKDQEYSVYLKNNA